MVVLGSAGGWHPRASAGPGFAVVADKRPRPPPGGGGRRDGRRSALVAAALPALLETLHERAAPAGVDRAGAAGAVHPPGGGAGPAGRGDPGGESGGQDDEAGDAGEP